MAAKALTIAVIAFLLLSAVVFAYFAGTRFPGTTSHATNAVCSSSSLTAPSVVVSISFNQTSAVRFYGNLMSPLGLFTDYPGSHTIWLSDDQALDYYALLRLNATTESGNAVELAQKANDSIVAWGGFCEYWNPPFEAFGSYPSTTQVLCGTNTTVGSSHDGYTISATEFKPCPGFKYDLYADMLAYRVLLDVHLGNYTGAESEFTSLSHLWDGYGFSDQVFQNDPSHTYQSYKLADYLIAWETLVNDALTRQFAQGFVTTVQSVAAVMSKMQSPSGGVWTGYRILDGELSYGNGISQTNGETTSLFVFAIDG